MREINSDNSLVVYRLCRHFPPRYPEDYVPAGNRRSFTSQPENVQRASKGLSVYSSVDAVTGNARKFPQIGTVIVRYVVSANPALEITHLVGPLEHLTVFGDFSNLHACLDASWYIDIATMDE
jgi:hypothetical protein